MKLDTDFALAMRAAGISQKALAEQCGCSRWTVARWMHGKLPVPKYAWSIVRLHPRHGGELADDIAAERAYYDDERERGNAP